ncbi:MAG: HAD-IC family P-type ATPase [Deltaproteobacteria bacterium]|nr:HAD-IC family P-type ATPase [Deltaproteobacteria bacterium]
MAETETPTGLSQAEVDAQRARGLGNATRRVTSRTVGAIVRSNFLSVFNLAVFVIAGVLVLLFFWKHDRRTLVDGLAISTVALLNTLVSIVQEIRAKRALDRIAALARPTATVVRDGTSQDVPTDEIVAGDVLHIRRGDQIPVDGPVLQSRHCEVDESLLTGESEYVYKEAGAEVRSGSFCVAGSAFIRAAVVGAESYVNRLARQARSYKRASTPLQRAIDRLVTVLLGVAGALAVLVVGAAWLASRRRGLNDLLIIDTTRSVAAVATSMIPVGLILLATVAFALGVFRISRRGALVQKLNAVESFAHVDVLCMDKTGTLTRNCMRVQEVTPAAGVTVAEAGRLLAALAHGCTERNATIEAIQAFAPAPALEVRDEIPFNSRDKVSAVAVALDDQVRHLYLGALEVLAPRLGEAERGAASATVAAGPGLRHVALCECREAPTSLREHHAARGALRLLAVVAVVDEVRPDVREVLAGFAAQSIELKVVSGDAPETVRAVARAAGWRGDTGRVMTGADLDGLPPADLAACAGSVSLFARVSPQNKRDLVAALQGQGRYVAMVGDGVNDVLALKQANLGVAMGAGNRMAKDVSDLVLVANDFAVLPRVLDEGRTIIGNVQSAARLFVTKNVYAALLIVGAVLLGVAFPFVPRHVTVIGFFAISVPALMITCTRRMHDVPRDFLRELLRFVGVSGGLIAVAAAAVYLGSQHLLGATVGEARTVLLSTIVPLSLLNFLVIIGGRHWRVNLRRNWEFSLFALGVAALYVATLASVTRVGALQPLRAFLEVEPLTGAAVALVGGVTGVCGALLALLQLGRRG